MVRWFRSNVGTICSEESVRVLEDGAAVGTLEASYAERLAPGDRFVLDGRCAGGPPAGGRRSSMPASGRRRAEPAAMDQRSPVALARAGRASWPAFRAEAARRLGEEGTAAAPRLADRATLELEPGPPPWSIELFEAQEQWSEVPAAEALLVEESPAPEGPGRVYTFHAPLHRSACEAMARAVGARLGRRFGRDLVLGVADLGWSIRLPEDAAIAARETCRRSWTLDRLDDDVLEGLDRGELLARRFRHVAATALMVLRNPEPGRRVRVGGLNWVSTRLYPLVRAACPDHPLLRQTRREVLEERARRPGGRAMAGIAAVGPVPRACRASRRSPPPGSSRLSPDALRFESPAEALRRLHQRLISAGAVGTQP